MLAVERRILAAATGRVGIGVGVVRAEEIDRVLRSRSSLSSEQADVVRRLLTDGHGVDVVRAAAGTGKTYPLDAARAASEAGGFRLCGCTLSARAAAELQSQSGIPS